MKKFAIAVMLCCAIHAKPLFANDSVLSTDELKNQTDLVATSSDMPSGTQIGIFKSYAGVWACANKAKSFWGPSRANNLTAEFDAALRTVLEQYQIVEPISKNDIFNNSASKDFKIAVIVKKSNFEICLDGSGANPKGFAEIVIEVNVFSNKEEKIIYSREYSSKAASEERISGGPFVIISTAFSNAMLRFLQDMSPKFEIPSTAKSEDVDQDAAKNGSEKAKEICLDLGFKIGTDGFSECYLETIKKI